MARHADVPTPRYHLHTKNPRCNHTPGSILNSSSSHVGVPDSNDLQWVSQGGNRDMTKIDTHMEKHANVATLKFRGMRDKKIRKGKHAMIILPKNIPPTTDSKNITSTTQSEGAIANRHPKRNAIKRFRSLTLALTLFMPDARYVGAPATCFSTARTLQTLLWGATNWFLHATWTHRQTVTKSQDKPTCKPTVVWILMDSANCVREMDAQPTRSLHIFANSCRWAKTPNDAGHIFPETSKPQFGAWNELGN